MPSPGDLALRTPLVLALLLSSPPLGSRRLSPENEALIRRVDDHYNHLASLETHYSEHYTGMGMDRTESGTLLLKKPGRMRWTYTNPVGKLFILDGKNGWFYTPGDPQAQHISARQLDDLRSPLRFLLGHTQLKKELENIAVRPVPGGYEITGIPKGMNQRLYHLVLSVDIKGLIIAMTFEEVDGSKTDFTFSAMRENIPVTDMNFVFKAPPGVAIVDGLPPI